MNIHIFQKYEDVDTLLSFVHDMIRASYNPAYPREVMDLFLCYHSADNLRHDMETGRVWVAREGNGILGTVTVADGELTRMFVSPAVRGKGLGTGLAREAIEFARQSGVMKLTAWAVPFARGFYEKLGFVLLNADVTNFEGTRNPPVPYLEMVLWPQSRQEITISQAEENDIVEMLAGQRQAFEEQCRIYDDWRIPPMTEQSEDVAGFVASGGVVLKAERCGRIIGAVRGRIDTGICHVGRLYVLPEAQGEGVGRMLVAALEETCAACHTYSIYTGERSVRNLVLYERQGYALTGRRAPARPQGETGQYDLVWLEKPNPWPAVLECIGRYPANE